MANTIGGAAAIPPDDPTTKLTLANPGDPKLRHVSVAGGTYTILVTGAPAQHVHASGAGPVFHVGRRSHRQP